MANGDEAANGLAVGLDLQTVQAQAPPIDLTFGRQQQYNPLSLPTGFVSTSPLSLAPVDTGNQLVSPAPGATAGRAAAFDFGLGDSIAVQQMRNQRVPSYEGPQWNPRNPAPFQTGQWAAVGDSPQRILDRYDYLDQNGEFADDRLKGKNIFLGIGSNDPSQMDAVKTLLGRLHDAGVANVVVPGMGPGVQGSEDANRALKDVVEGAGYTYFQPSIKWAQDGVHPANSRDMYNQAVEALGRAAGRATGAPIPLTVPGTGPQVTGEGQPADVNQLMQPRVHVPVQQQLGGPPTPGAGGVGGMLPPEQVKTIDDYDQGRVVKGAFLPNGQPVTVAMAKKFIRMREPGEAGYNARFGEEGSRLPDNVTFRETGFPDLPGRPIGNMYGGPVDGKTTSTASGMYQIEGSTWDPIARLLGISKFDPESQEKITTYLLENQGMLPWTPWNANLAADWNEYLKSGTVPNRPDPREGRTISVSPQTTQYVPKGTLQPGQTVPGTDLAVGGRGAIVPPVQVQAPSMYDLGRNVRTALGPTGGQQAPAGGGGALPPGAQAAAAEIARLQQQGSGGPDLQRAMRLAALANLTRQGFKLIPVSYDPRKVMGPQEEVPYRGPVPIGRGIEGIPPAGRGMAPAGPVRGVTAEVGMGARPVPVREAPVREATVPVTEARIGPAAGTPAASRFYVRRVRNSAGGLA